MNAHVTPYYLAKITRLNDAKLHKKKRAKETYMSQIRLSIAHKKMSFYKHISEVIKCRVIKNHR